MHKTKLTFAAAAICGGLLALAPMSGAFAAPIAPIGKAADENDSRSMVYYRYYHHLTGTITSPLSSLLVALRPSPLPLVEGRAANQKGESRSLPVATTAALNLVL